jgi:LysR family transcriptional regulator for metE and metH
MECYPCFQWLLKIVAPFLKAYPDVDVDVLKEFQFGGMSALFNYDIDILVTPDPVFKKELDYIPVFDYEQVLVTSVDHPLSKLSHINAEDLRDQVLITYPIENSRLDVFTQLLIPQGGSVAKHKRVETTEIILQMVEANRGVSVLPRWLIEEQSDAFQLKSVKIGPEGLHKKIYLGLRTEASQPAFISAFVEMAL